MRRTAMAGLLAAPLAFILLTAVRASAAIPAVQDIRDIHGPIQVVSSHPRWWAVAAGAAVVVAATAAAMGKSLARRNLPPHLRALRALARQRSLAAGHPRDFAIAVSDTVRVYLEEAFELRAPRRTTEELLADLVCDRSGPLAAQQFELAEFLRQCDLAKFAGARLSAARMNAMLDSAEALVRATTAAPAAARPLGGAVS